MTASRRYALLLLLAVGCTESPPQPKDALPVSPVSGMLTYKGNPMTGAVVVFHPSPTAAPQPTPHAVADANGRYALTTYRTDDGAPAGDYRVTIHWPVENFKPPKNDPDPPLPPDRLKGTYTDPKRSKLRATVEPKENVIDFALN